MRGRRDSRSLSTSRPCGRSVKPAVVMDCVADDSAGTTGFERREMAGVGQASGAKMWSHVDVRLTGDLLDSAPGMMKADVGVGNPWPGEFRRADSARRMPSALSGSRHPTDLRGSDLRRSRGMCEQHSHRDLRAKRIVPAVEVREVRLHGHVEAILSSYQSCSTAGAVASGFDGDATSKMVSGVIASAGDTRPVGAGSPSSLRDPNA